MNRRVTAVIILAVVLLIVAYSATFFVHQSYNAVVVVVSVLAEGAGPGLAGGGDAGCC